MNYFELAPLTASTTMHFDKVSVSVLQEVIEQRLVDAPMLDAVKKGLFYGKEQPTLDGIDLIAETSHLNEETLAFEMDRLHGILGMATEADELLTLFLDGELDRETIADEAGDLLWYLALLLKGAGLTFEEVATANLRKLEKRFPAGAFDLEAWNNRDKIAEKKEISAVL